MAKTWERDKREEGKKESKGRTRKRREGACESCAKHHSKHTLPLLVHFVCLRLTRSPRESGHQPVGRMR